MDRYGSVSLLGAGHSTDRFFSFSVAFDGPAGGFGHTVNHRISPRNPSSFAISPYSVVNPIFRLTAVRISGSFVHLLFYAMVPRSTHGS